MKYHIFGKELESRPNDHWGGAALLSDIPWANVDAFYKYLEEQGIKVYHSYPYIGEQFYMEPMDDKSFKMFAQFWIDLLTPDQLIVIKLTYC